MVKLWIPAVRVAGSVMYCSRLNRLAAAAELSELEKKPVVVCVVAP